MDRATSSRFRADRTRRTVPRRGRFDGAFTVLVVLLAVTRPGCLANSQNLDGDGPADGKPWATPVACPGVPKVYKVTDDLYRGGQPEDEGFRELAAMGIKTVVNLRTTATDRDETVAAGLAYEHIRFHPCFPEDEDVIRFLRIVTDPRRTPVFVHCWGGAERTSVMCAAYRIIVCDWSKGEATSEMLKGPFGFCPIWWNLVLYIQNLDVAKIQQALAPAQ